MIRKLRSGKFWLKLTFGLSLLWIAIMSAGYAVSVWGLSDARIHTALQQAMPAGRNIHIGLIAERDWLPYPSVTLRNVSITYPNRTSPQIDIKELNISLSWKSVFGQAQVQKLRLMQPQAHISRLQDNSWNIDDFYQNPRIAEGVGNIEVVDGTLNVQETLHQYDLTSINASVQNWQAPQSQLHLAFDWQAPWAGKQQVNLEASLQKNAHGFRSRDLHIQLDNQLPEIGKVTWRADGELEHFWLEHRSEFRNINVVGSDETESFKANFSIPQARWRKIWRLNQATGLVQWNNDKQHLTTATIKLSPTEFNSQYFKTDNSSVDLLVKKPRETLSVKAAGHVEIKNSGDFILNNWQISSRQTDMNLQTDALFRSDGVLNAFGNTQNRWNATWNGTFDDENAKLELTALDAQNVEMNLVAQSIDLERYQNWLQREPDTQTHTAVASDAATTKAEASKKNNTQWLQQWQRLPEKWQLKGSVDIANLVMRQMQLDDVHADLSLNRDVLNLEKVTANAYGGQLQAALEIPRADEANNILKLQLTDMQVQPWLQHWREYSRLSGTGSMVLYASAIGNNWDVIQNNLNGELGFELKNGSFQGIALESLLQKTGDTNMQLKLDDGSATEFDLFKTHSRIKAGVFQTDIVDLSMPMGLELSGQGKYHLPNNKLDYHLKFGQGLIEKSALPIRLSGPILQPNFSLDYQSLTKGLTTSTDKSNAVRDALKRQWQLWQMPELPITKP